MSYGPNRYFGRAGRGLAVPGLRASESTYDAGLALPRHAHPRAHFCLVLSGEYRETLEGTTEMRGPITLIYYPPECSHTESHCAGGRHFLVEWETEWAERSGCESRLPSRPLVVRRLPAVFAALRAFRLLHSDRAVHPCELEEAMGSVLTELDPRCKAAPRRAPRWLHLVMDRLRASPGENVALCDLADAAKVHPSHLGRVCRQFTGCTLGELRRRFQVEHACRHLVSGADALCLVAVDAGFADQSHMTRAMREATGFTPGALRSVSVGRDGA